MNNNDLEPLVYSGALQPQTLVMKADCDCACALVTPAISPAPLSTAACWQAAPRVECDCYGALSSPTVSPAPLLPTARWQAAPGLYRAALAPGYELVSPVYGPVGAVVLNAAAGRVLDALAGEPCSVEQAAARLPEMAPEVVHGAVQNLAALNLVESV